MIRSSIADDGNEALLARRAFLCGWACLPLLWVVNAFYFREKLQAGELAPETRKWVMLSMTAAGVSTALFILWLVTFQTSWKAWEWSTDIMVSVPDSDLSGW
ncbi:unnamed protein product [Laminaria digitata]